MTTYNHTAIVNGDSRKNDAAIWNEPLGSLDAAIGALSALNTSNKSSVVAAANELRTLLLQATAGATVDSEVITARAAGNVGATAASLTEWLEWTTRNVFPVESYGLVIGTGQSAGVKAANAAAIVAAIAAAGAAGGGVVMLPAGDIEIDQVTVSSLPNNIAIQGAGKGATRLHHSKNVTGSAIRLFGNATAIASTTLSTKADGSDVRLRVASVSGFAAGQLIYLRDTEDRYDHIETTLTAQTTAPSTAVVVADTFAFNEGDTVQYDLAGGGTETNTIASINAGALTITLTNAPTDDIANGATIGSLTGSWPFEPRPNLDNGEWMYILNVDTDNTELGLHMSVQSSQSYPATHTTVIAPTMTRNIKVSDFSIVIDVADDSYGGINFNHIDGLSVSNLEVIRAAQVGITIGACVNVTLSDCTIFGGDDNASTTTGYGIQINASQWVDVWGCKIYKQRRAIDLSGGWPCRYVNIFGNSLWGSYVDSSWSILGTHSTAEYCVFSNNILVGAGTSGGVYVRGNAIKIVGNTFLGCNIPILLTDGATHEIIGNIVDGRKRWSVDSGGRFTEEFVRVNSRRLTNLVMSGNVVNIETMHCNFNAKNAVAEVWIRDEVRFRAGAPGTQDILRVTNGAVTAHIDCISTNYDNVARVADGASGTITLVTRNTPLPQLRSRSLLLADDAVGTFALPTTGGCIVMVSFGNNANGAVLLNVRAIATSYCTIISQSASVFEVTTGALSAGGGTDGKVTVSVHTDGLLYISNRIGSTRTFTVTVFGS